MAHDGGEFSHGMRVVRVVTRRNLRRWKRQLRRWWQRLRESQQLTRLLDQLQQLRQRLLAGRPQGSGAEPSPQLDHPGQDAIEAFKVARAITPPPQSFALGEDPQRGRQRVESEDRELKRQVTHGLAAEQAGFRKRKREK